MLTCFLALQRMDLFQICPQLLGKELVNMHTKQFLECDLYCLATSVKQHGLIFKVSGLYLGQNSTIFLAFHNLCMLRNLTWLPALYQPFHPVVFAAPKHKTVLLCPVQIPFLLSSITHGTSPLAERVNKLHEVFCFCFSSKISTLH